MKLPGLTELSLILILASNSQGSEDEKWDINVTRHIDATPGSNVYIPCTFTYPKKHHTPSVQVYWKKAERSKFNTFDNDKNAFVFHKNNTFVLKKYRGKTTLIGNKDKGNCSLEIRNITENEPNIYVRVIAKGDNYSFTHQSVSISLSGPGVTRVIINTDTTNTSLPTFEPTTMVTNVMKTSAHMYTAIFVPVTALLIIIFVTGIVCCIKHKRSQTLTREESGYYANFSRASSNEAKRDTSCQNHDNKKLPEPKAIDEPVYLKAIDEPVYINMEAPPVMELKLWLSFLLLHVVHDVQSSRGQWTANVPKKIPALQGSCVIIPCTYTYPKPTSNKILNRWRGFWRKGNKIVSTNLPKWKLPEEYKKRTQFLGNLQSRNCTMLLDGIRKTDVGPFYFRIEMPQYKSFSYTKNAVSIDVIRNPQPPSLSVEVNDKVTAICSVSHSCPSIPPQFSWSRNGIVTRRSKRLNVWKWETVSTLTFDPRPADFNKPLNCTVQFRGGKQARSSTILRI